MKTKANFTTYEYQQMQRREAIEALKKIKEKENENRNPNYASRTNSSNG